MESAFYEGVNANPYTRASGGRFLIWSNHEGELGGEDYGVRH
jgi:hypothetical protein